MEAKRARLSTPVGVFHPGSIRLSTGGFVYQAETHHSQSIGDILEDSKSDIILAAFNSSDTFVSGFVAALVTPVQPVAR